MLDTSHSIQLYELKFSANLVDRQSGKHPSTCHVEDDQEMIILTDVARFSGDISSYFLQQAQVARKAPDDEAIPAPGTLASVSMQSTSLCIANININISTRR